MLGILLLQFQQFQQFPNSKNVSLTENLLLIFPIPIMMVNKGAIEHVHV